MRFVLGFLEELQSRYRLAADQVPFDVLVHVGFGDVDVPDALGIDDNAAASRAVVEAAGLVGADLLVEPARAQRFLELLQDPRRSLARAVALGIVGVALVEADEEVLLERRRHQASSSASAPARRPGPDAPRARARNREGSAPPRPASAAASASSSARIAEARSARAPSSSGIRSSACRCRSMACAKLRIDGVTSSIRAG